MKIIQVLSKFRNHFQHIPSIPYTTTEEVRKLLKEVNAKKASGFDKLAAGVLAAPLSKTINSISKGAFPNEAKTDLCLLLIEKHQTKSLF